MPNQKSILYLVANARYFISHRLHLALSAEKSGYKVYVVTTDPDLHLLYNYNWQIIDIKISRGGINFWQALTNINELIKIYRTIKPNIVHHVGLKLSLYGTIAARITGVNKIINAIAGMGYIFTSQHLIAKILKFFLTTIFKVIFNRANQIFIVQNDDDASYWNKLLPIARVVNIPGAGVNIDRFYPIEEPTYPPYIVTLVARMLWTKGVREFVEAAKIIHQQSHLPKIIFQLVGEPDNENPETISEQQLIEWHNQGIINYLGGQKDIATIYQNSHLAVLPSYREGFPKSLLEAAACGKPIITCDVTGCRAIVEKNNGVLIPARNSRALSAAIIKLIGDDHLRKLMAVNSRKLVLENFTEEKIQQQTLQLYKD